MMWFDKPSIGYWGMRWMCFEPGYKNKAYYQNMIFTNIPELIDLPPVFLSTSAEDALCSMTLYFEETLKKLSVPYQLKYYPHGRSRKLGHMFSIHHPEYPESRELTDEMLSFFLRQCSVKKQ